ncbi:phosphate-induced protein 1 [Zychaea mexicana]|uniref:phosphate-induced protein 1 n=1 Tax=Zychaea mexicana TaxID=64656 RepID=UPI0022FDE1E5|nr:phosphate-induced protein 1 [Zychaea mexicana]KAI9498706.1 phosphate-induced protein 1 [Zychaea mexicana]
MLLSTLGALVLSGLAGLATAQDDQLTTISNSTTSTPIATLYGDSFKSAGGKVLNDKVNVFYGNWTSSQDEQTTFMNFVDGVSSTQWFNTLKQYTDSDSNAVTGPLNVAAAVNDAGSRGLTLSDTNAHKQIILDAVNSGYLSATNQIDPHGVYVLFAGSDVSDSEFCTKNCGYNSHSDEFQYMFIGYPGTCADYCIPPMIKDKSPNGSPAIDAAVTIFSHEIQDVLTDPRNDAWMIQQNGTTIELGDFCAGSDVPDGEWYGTVSQDSNNNATYNLEVGNQKFLVQTVFDLQNKKCILSAS